MSDARVDNARDTYHWLYSQVMTHVGWRILPTPELDGNEARERVDSLLNELETDEEGFTLAPSPWHAVFALELMQETQPSHPVSIFRGQRDNSWRFVPSLRRPTINASRERRVALAFERIAQEFMTWLHSPIPRMVDEAYLAVAQHYGVATDLLDWTADPHVAVYFASKDGPAESGNSAAVYSLRFTVARMIGGRVFLPHPWADRVYVQQGMFVDLNKSAEELLWENKGVVRFIPDARFQIYRHGEAINIEPKSDILEPLVRLAREWVETREGEIDEETAKEIVESITSANGKSGFVSQAIARALSEPKETGDFDGYADRDAFLAWFGHMNLLLTRLCYTWDDDSLQIDEAVLNALVTDNGFVTRNFYLYAQELWADAKEGSVNDIMRNCLERALTQHRLIHVEDEPWYRKGRELSRELDELIRRFPDIVGNKDK
jgi:hypothetical protein